jgi:hypothetical protein
MVLRRPDPRIDALQNRAGTRSALFVDRQESAARQIGGAAGHIGAAYRKAGGHSRCRHNHVRLVESSVCAGERIGVTEDSAHISLGKQDAGNFRVLLQVSCGNGAYNMAVAPYVGSSADGKKWSLRAGALRLSGSGAMKGMDGVKLLSNPSWDAATQQLSSFHKGRGLGDCGTAETYVWDGAMCSAWSKPSAMDECRGSTEWMQLWRARVEFKGLTLRAFSSSSATP